MKQQKDKRTQIRSESFFKHAEKTAEMLDSTYTKNLMKQALKSIRAAKAAKVNKK